MAQKTLYLCDVDGCESKESAIHSLPPNGWFTIYISEGDKLKETKNCCPKHLREEIRFKKGTT